MYDSDLDENTKRQKRAKRRNGQSTDTARIPAQRAPACFVYFARCEGFIKIGIARDVYTRVKVLATASPWPVELAGYMVGGEQEESVLHRRFKRLRHRNEWFREEGELAELVRIVATEPTPRQARAAANDWYYDHATSRHASGELGGTKWRSYIDAPEQMDPPRSLSQVHPDFGGDYE